MPRVEVEELLGPPTAEAVHPVCVTEEGRPTYHTAYHLVEPPSAAEGPPVPSGFSLLPLPYGPKTAVPVSLEFDASQPGHPLIAVHFLDPLF